MDEYNDRVLECCECGVEFVFSVGEQLFFEQRNFSTPRRCKPCRQARALRPVNPSARGTR